MLNGHRLVVLAGLILVFQLIGGVIFALELFADLLWPSIWTLNWHQREVIQLAAMLSLVLGALASAALLVGTLRRAQSIERQLHAASGAFHLVMEAQFKQWELTPTEAEVALLVLEGLSNQEIAQLRGKSEATIKTQINAVFRKASVQSRAQLMSQFVNLLMAKHQS